jgi:hypothetical protein
MTREQAAQPPRSHGEARRPAGPIHNEAQREVGE